MATPKKARGRNRAAAISPTTTKPVESEQLSGLREFFRQANALSAMARTPQSANGLTAFQHEVLGADWLRQTIHRTNLVAYLESLGAISPQNKTLPSETRLLCWSDASVIDSLPGIRNSHCIHQAFEVVADALRRFREQLSNQFKATRKKRTATELEHLENLSHAENEFRVLHEQYPQFQAMIYLHPVHLRQLHLRQRSGLTDVIEMNPPDECVRRRRLHRLDKNGVRVPVVWEEFGFDLNTSDEIEDILAGPWPTADDVGPRLLGKLKRAVVRLDDLRSNDPEAMKQPAWPMQSLEAARLKLSEIVAELELEVETTARDNVKPIAQTADETLKQQIRDAIKTLGPKAAAKKNNIYKEVGGNRQATLRAIDVVRREDAPKVPSSGTENRADP